jgi:HEXXH motif-containing protein
MATAVDAHFGTLLVGHAAIVCLLRCKKLGATLDSWTISRLPGTIFTDHTGEAAILARDLIHEAGHNWLNDALAALEIKLDPEKSFFSPWKHTNRPAFGFLHACWAFPLTMIFAASVLDRLTERVREYLSVYLRQQVEALASTAEDHARALALIPDTDLRDRLQTVYRAALALRA